MPATRTASSSGVKKKKTATRKTASTKKKSTKVAKPATKKPALEGKLARASSASNEFDGFSVDLFGFLVQLGLHNERPWFEKNKARYEACVREPALSFVRAMEPRLSKFSKHLVASDKKVGGSLMRIHRDIRFSADKTPYKTNVGIHFRHAAGKDVHAPGVYLHLEPGECFIGAGIWRPDADTLRSLRQALVDDPTGWKKACRSIRPSASPGSSGSSTKLESTFSLAGDSLKRVPKGFDPDHPLADDLRRKDFIAVATLDPKEAQKPDFPARLTDRLMATKPLCAWLCKALGLPF